MTALVSQMLAIATEWLRGLRSEAKIIGNGRTAGPIILTT